MANQSIGIGSAADDGTGDNLRVAIDKVNDNFFKICMSVSAFNLNLIEPAL